MPFVRPYRRKGASQDVCYPQSIRDERDDSYDSHPLTVVLQYTIRKK